MRITDLLDFIVNVLDRIAWPFVVAYGIWLLGRHTIDAIKTVLEKLIGAVDRLAKSLKSAKVGPVDLDFDAPDPPETPRLDPP